MSVDVRLLAREGRLYPGSFFRVRWQDEDGDEIASIGGAVLDDAVEFRYRQKGYWDDEWRDFRAAALIERTPCHLGGQRPWFLCPSCHRRCAILYVGPRVGCRACFRLVYQSQRETALDRQHRRVAKVYRKLGGDYVGAFSEFPDKPTGMHWRTYDRLAGEASRALDAMDALALQRLAGILGDR